MVEYLRLLRIYIQSRSFHTEKETKTKTKPKTNEQTKKLLIPV